MSGLDWSILAAYILLTTWLGEILAGKQQTIRDFFLGGRRLPWTAVGGSIVASEISGVTFVSVPLLCWQPGGDFRYLQLWLGYLVARLIIGYFFTPAFYRGEIYSPYQYMGARLGRGVEGAATGLFFTGCFLAQGTRLYLAALVLDAITDMGIPWAIALLGVVSVLWTWIGGISTVIWTDVIQFGILFIGGAAMLVAVCLKIPGGIGEVMDVGGAAGKFRILDLRIDMALEFTLWSGLIGGAFQNLASHGTDQMMAQRLFCCRDERAARKAIVGSTVAVILAVMMLAVGAALYAYFLREPLTGAEQAKVDARRDYLLPIFVLRAMPPGMKGLLFAAIFAAATATSTLSAMAQTALMSVYKPLLKREPDERRLVRVSRFFVAASGALLCGGALLCSVIPSDIFRMSMNMATYTSGPLLGAFLLALLPFGRDGRGLIWSIPYSMLLVLALQWHQKAWVFWVVMVGTAGFGGAGLWRLRGEWTKVAWVVLGTAPAVMVVLAHRPAKLGSFWLFPLGTLLTLGLGAALGRKSLAAAKEPSVSSPGA